MLSQGLAFAREYHEYVHKRWADEPLPTLDSRLIFTEGGYHTESPGGVSWNAVVYDVVGHAWQAVHAENLCHALRNVGLPRMVAAPDTVEWEHLREFILREALAPIVDTYKAIGGIQFDEDIAASQWRRWEAHWTANAETKVLYVLLDQLSLVVPTVIELAPGVSLEPVTTTLQQDLWREAHGAFAILPLEEFSRAKAALRVQGPPRPRNSGLEAELEVADRAITALRLAVPGHFWPLGPIRTVLAPAIEPPMVMLHYKGQAPMWFSKKRGQPALVDPASGANAAVILHELYAVGQVHSKAGLELPLRRFEQTFSREFNEDVLVDLAIVLESTLLADVPDNELKYRTSLRGAALLASQCPVAESISTLRKLYDARSVVVHRGVRLADVAGKGQLKGMKVADFVPAAENVVRAILRTLLQRCASGQTVQTIAKALEAQIEASLSK